MSTFNLKSKLVKEREGEREEYGEVCLIFKHCQWITVFSLQICTAFKGIMSISCLFFIWRPRCPVGREQLEDTQGKITIQKGEPTYSQNIPVECELMFSRLWYFHVEFFFFFLPRKPYYNGRQGF